MVGAGQISHNPNLAGEVGGAWTKLGENVGVGYDVASLMQAFIDSPGHYQNLVEPSWNYVGVGVQVAGDGRIYTTHDFMQLPEAAAPLSPPPAPPPPPPPPTPVPTTAPPPPATSAPTTTVSPPTTTAPRPAPATPAAASANDHARADRSSAHRASLDRHLRFERASAPSVNGRSSTGEHEELEDCGAQDENEKDAQSDGGAGSHDVDLLGERWTDAAASPSPPEGAAPSPAGAMTISVPVESPSSAAADRRARHTDSIP